MQCPRTWSRCHPWRGCRRPSSPPSGAHRYRQQKLPSGSTLRSSGGAAGEPGGQSSSRFWPPHRHRRRRSEPRRLPKKPSGPGFPATEPRTALHPSSTRGAFGWRRWDQHWVEALSAPATYRGKTTTPTLAAGTTGPTDDAGSSAHPSAVCMGMRSREPHDAGALQRNGFGVALNPARMPVAECQLLQGTRCRCPRRSIHRRGRRRHVEAGRW